jgi:hypothetical protein
MDVEVAPPSGLPNDNPNATALGARAFQVGARVVTAAVLPNGGMAGGPSRSPGRPDLLYAFTDRDAVAKIVEAGLRKLGETRRFALTLRYGSYLREKLGTRVAAVGGPGFDLGRALLVGAHAARAAVGHRLDWLADPDERFDRLWQEAHAEYPLIGVRDAAFVRRLLGRPEGGLSLAALSRRRTKAVEGYVVVERADDTVHVRDVFARRAAMTPLFRLLAAAIERWGAETISVCLCGAPALVTTLSRLGFREEPDARPVVVDVSASLGGAATAVFDADYWYLTDADR